MISERLKEIRILLGYGDKQKEFAEKLDMKQGSYSDVERGKTKSISKKMIRNLYTVFGVNKDFLINGNLPMLVDKKDEGISNSSGSMADNHLSQLLLILRMKDEHIKELIDQQGVLIQQQTKLVDAILNLTIRQ